MKLPSPDSPMNTMVRSTPSPVKLGCWMREIAVPWNQDLAVIALGL